MYREADIYRTTVEAGEQLRLSPKALANSRSSGKGIKLPFIKLVFFPKKKLDMLFLLL